MNKRLEIKKLYDEVNARGDLFGFDLVAHFPLSKVHGRYKILKRVAYENDRVIRFTTLQEILNYLTAILDMILVFN
jgi:hypothetical protein